MRKRAITTGLSFRRDRSAFLPTDSLFMMNFPQASGYFFVKPQCVPPPYLLPSVKHPFLRQALYLSSHAGPPPRPMHVLFHVEHMSAATAGVPNVHREVPRTTKQAAISLLRMMCILPLTNEEGDDPHLPSSLSAHAVFLPGPFLA
jgi:hypothetical protein